MDGFENLCLLITPGDACVVDIRERYTYNLSKCFLKRNWRKVFFKKSTFQGIIPINSNLTVIEIWVAQIKFAYKSSNPRLLFSYK